MNTYLITSDSYKLLKEEINKIVPDISLAIKYDLRTSSLTDVINEAGYFSLTSEMKYIIVNAGDLFKAGKKEEDSKDIKLLESYLQNPNELACLIFTSSEKPDKRKKTFKMINDSNHYIEVPSMNKKELCYKCISILKEKKYSCSYEVASYIVENSYSNYDIMTSELEKIYVLLKPGTLTIESIKDIISKGVVNGLYNYINAIINRDLKEAITAVNTFAKSKIDPIVVLISLAKEMQILYYLCKGAKPKDIQYAFNKEEWQIKNYLNNMACFTENELKKIIIKLNDYDYRLKSGVLDKNVALDLIALDLCA